MSCEACDLGQVFSTCACLGRPNLVVAQCVSSDLDIILPSTRLHEWYTPAYGSHAQVAEDSNLDNCVLCGLGGNLICCDGCPAAVHLRCIGETAKSIPDGEWLCAECRMGSRGEHRISCCTVQRERTVPMSPCIQY